MCMCRINNTAEWPKQGKTYKFNIQQQLNKRTNALGLQHGNISSSCKNSYITVFYAPESNCYVFTVNEGFILITAARAHLIYLLCSSYLMAAILWLMLWPSSFDYELRLTLAVLWAQCCRILFSWQRSRQPEWACSCTQTLNNRKLVLGQKKALVPPFVKGGHVSGWSNVLGFFEKDNPLWCSFDLVCALYVYHNLLIFNPH